MYNEITIIEALCYFVQLIIILPIENILTHSSGQYIYIYIYMYVVEKKYSFSANFNGNSYFKENRCQVT